MKHFIIRSDTISKQPGLDWHFYKISYPTPIFYKPSTITWSYSINQALNFTIFNFRNKRCK